MSINPFEYHEARDALKAQVDYNTFDFVYLGTQVTEHAGILHLFSREDPPDEAPSIYAVRAFCGQWVIVSMGLPQEEDSPDEPYMGYTPGEDARPESGAFPGERFRA